MNSSSHRHAIDRKLDHGGHIVPILKPPAQLRERSNAPLSRDGVFFPAQKQHPPTAKPTGGSFITKRKQRKASAKPRTGSSSSQKPHLTEKTTAFPHEATHFYFSVTKTSTKSRPFTKTTAATYSHATISRFITESRTTPLYEATIFFANELATPPHEKVECPFFSIKNATLQLYGSTVFFPKITRVFHCGIT
ncbi:hypothetical protein BIW11_12231 [Tropilaelaps mercedesae]|uniref:Uncharacterized protein n=1 Tax=Tropilaelaps mercedesae TaxID=418985 RepID=A0A1V9X850_9ACAR|nr:hypothetical protein BIW11_12231 [Tropilaelaps mercedesae]